MTIIASDHITLEQKVALFPENICRLNIKRVGMDPLIAYCRQKDAVDWQFLGSESELPDIYLTMSEGTAQITFEKFDYGSGNDEVKALPEDLRTKYSRGANSDLYPALICTVHYNGSRNGKEIVEELHNFIKTTYTS